MNRKRQGKTLDREAAYRAVINTWLKANPQNIQYCGEVIEENKMARVLQSNEFGTAKDLPMDLRRGLRIPEGLYYTLDQFERLHSEEGEDRRFLATKQDFYWFMKTFPQFSVAERI